MREGGSVADYVDVVIVAQLHSYFGKERSADLPNLVTTPAFLKLGLSKMGSDASLEVLFEAERSIQKIMTMLK